MYVFVFQIRSDKENFTKILYFLSGPGADETPKDVFGVDKHTGFVKIYSILDREKIPFYRVRALTCILFVKSKAFAAMIFSHDTVCFFL